MATAKQIQANRLNAQRSTGPRTPEGKARSSMNALRHGLTAETIVLVSEEEPDYHDLRGALLTSYAPANAHEMMLVDNIAAGYWRTIRARKFEKAIFDIETANLKRKLGLKTAPDPEHDHEAAALVLCSNDEARYRNYFRYDASISRDYYRAIATLERVQARRRRDELAAQREAERRPHPDTIAIPSPEPPPPRPAPLPRRHAVGFVSSPAAPDPAPQPAEPAAETNPAPATAPQPASPVSHTTHSPIGFVSSPARTPRTTAPARNPEPFGGISIKGGGTLSRSARLLPWK
jgi:hypothetical protein